jgi:hypothetical protein
MDIRKLALVNFIAAVLCLLIPIWNGTQRLLPSGQTWVIPFMVLLSLFSAIMPAFYFALYRNQGTLHFPRRSRLLALGAAVVFVMVVAAEWVMHPRGATSVLDPPQSPWTISNAGTLVNELSNLAYTLLLVALFRQAGDDSDPDTPVLKALRLTAKVAVIAWGIWLGFILVRMGVTPFVYHALRERALRAGVTPPRLGNILGEIIRQFLSQACLFTAPFIVYGICRNGVKVPAEDVAED